MHAFVLAGGRGLRLAPVSTDARPKPFINLLDDRRSLFQQTVQRLAGLPRLKAIGIIGNRRHGHLIREQLAALGPDAAIRWHVREPFPRNTGPAIVLTSLLIARHLPDMPLLFMPADHHHGRWENFVQALMQLMPAILDQPVIGLFGMPARPGNSSLGHIVLPKHEEARTARASCRPVIAFVEKPTPEQSRRLWQLGEVRANAGVILARAGTIVETAARLAPDLHAACTRALEEAAMTEDGCIRLSETSWRDCPDRPFDRAVLERARNLACCPCDSDWHDVGTWSGLWSALTRNAPKASQDEKSPWTVDRKRQTVCRGRTEIRNSTNIIAWADAHCRLSVHGLKDLAIIAAGSHVHVEPLIRPDHRSDHGSTASTDHAPSHFSETPWGAQAWLHRESELGIQVKWLRLRPGARTSLQSHHHRSEWLHVVSGELLLQIDEERHRLQAGMSRHVPCQRRHRLENDGTTTAHILEIQMGRPLDENDITRYEDDYGRA